jgi:hypothetical protein
MNMEPQALMDYGWFGALGCEAVSSDKPTGGTSNYDYFHVDSRIREYVGKAEHIELGTKPHVGVMLEVSFGLRATWARQLVAPKPLPTSRVIGCERKPCESSEELRIKASSPAKTRGELAEKFKALITYVEKKVVALTDCIGASAKNLQGRAEGPRYVWRALLGKSPKACRSCRNEGNAAGRYRGNSLR